MNDFDPIVDEVRRVPVAHATMFNYDLDAIFRDTNRGSERNYLYGTVSASLYFGAPPNCFSYSSLNGLTFGPTASSLTRPACTESHHLS